MTAPSTRTPMSRRESRDLATHGWAEYTAHRPTVRGARAHARAVKTLHDTVPAGMEEWAPNPAHAEVGLVLAELMHDKYGHAGRSARWFRPTRTNWAY